MADADFSSVEPLPGGQRMQESAREPATPEVRTEEDACGECVAEDSRLRFARIFAQNDRWLYAYLMTLLGNPSHADEVYQEVCVVLWREYERFDPETNFKKWASVIAHNQVRRFRRVQQRHNNYLSDEVIDLIAAEVVERSELLEARTTALNDCLQRLTESDRELIRRCYYGRGDSIKTVAQAVGRPVNTVYKALHRIRIALQGCIDRKVATQGLS